MRNLVDSNKLQIELETNANSVIAPLASHNLTPTGHQQTQNKSKIRKTVRRTLGLLSPSKNIFSCFLSPDTRRMNYSVYATRRNSLPDINKISSHNKYTKHTSKWT